MVIKIYKLNADFNYLEFEVIDKEAGRNAFVLTPKRWVETVNAAALMSFRVEHNKLLALPKNVTAHKN